LTEAVASSTETPSFSRAIAVSQRERQSPWVGFQVGRTCVCIASGT
jgi:hypothetical protein